MAYLLPIGRSGENFFLNLSESICHAFSIYCSSFSSYEYSIPWIHIAFVLTKSDAEYEWTEVKKRSSGNICSLSVVYKNERKRRMREKGKSCDVCLDQSKAKQAREKKCSNLLSSKKISFSVSKNGWGRNVEKVERTFKPWVCSSQWCKEAAESGENAFSFSSLGRPKEGRSEFKCLLFPHLSHQNTYICRQSFSAAVSWLMHILSTMSIQEFEGIFLFLTLLLPYK